LWQRQEPVRQSVWQPIHDLRSGLHAVRKGDEPRQPNAGIDGLVDHTEVIEDLERSGGDAQRLAEVDPPGLSLDQEMVDTLR
jgi:hypothetical protein